MPQKNRRRKTGKFAPLVWIITAAVIAFFIGYSNTIKNLPFLQKNNQTNYTFNLTNLIPPSLQSQGGLSNQQSSSSSAGSSITASSASSSSSSIISPTNNAQSVKVKIFLARRGDKEISLVEKTVLMPRTQSMLKDTLQLLIGYNDDKLMNLVPIKTKVKKVTIRDGIALIDLSEDFSYNSSGIIGYKVQINQIVYTATQFSKVKAVAFYINGKLAEYLGGDGYPVHNPVYPYSYLPKFPIE